MSGHISILENLTDAEMVRKKAAAEADFSEWTNKAVQIVTVGRLDIQKGIDLAVLACKKLHDEGMPVCWHVYGEGIQRNTLEKMIEENRLKGIFLLEGMKVNPYPYMAKADIIVQPSRYEGKSIVLDEAKVLGKAIVVTNYPSVKDQITDGETGLIVECAPEEIADGIKSLVNNKNVKNRLEKNNKRALEINTEVLNDFYRIVEM